MKSTRKSARNAGILFLIAMIASLIGGALLESSSNNSNIVMLSSGIALEILNALSVLGIGILLFTVVKDIQKNAAKAYLFLRILESAACLVAPLVLVLFTNSNDLRMFFTGTLIPLFFCSGALVLYSVLYAFRLLPDFITIWGYAGVIGIILLNLVNIEMEIGMLLALPIILNEIFLGIWLIVKGFNQPKKRYV